MKTQTQSHATSSGSFHPGALPVPYEDPLDPDAQADAVFMTTRRQLVRVAMIAAETGARFEREGVAHDPMTWMMASRRLFGGRAAIDACLGRESFVHALLLHGLGLGLDADRSEIAELVEDDDDGSRDVDDVGSAPSDDLDALRADEAALGHDPKLFCSVVVGRDGAGLVHAFEAVVACSHEAARERLRLRHGDLVAADAEVVEGFSPGGPVICTLVSTAVADMLAQVARDPSSPLARGLSISVEQRVAA
jgi:hypothetical protein